MRRLGVLLLLAAVPWAQDDEPAPSIRVRVVTFEGEPVANARLEVRRAVAGPFHSRWFVRSGEETPTVDARWWATPAGADHSLVAEAVTGAQGWAQFDELPCGAFDITALVPGLAVRGAQVLSPPVRGAPPPTILLDAGHTLAGRVLAEDGAAIPGALVAATYPSAGTARWQDDERPLLSRTDDRGAFRIEGVPEGTSTIRAGAAGAWSARDRQVEVPRKAPIEIVLPLHPLDAIVKDGRTGAPVAGALVFLSTACREAPGALGHAITDAKGCFRLGFHDRWLSHGEIRAPGYLRALRFASQDGDLDRLAGRTLEITAVPAAPLRGIVRDAEGPVASAIVRATWLAGFDTACVSARSGSDGEFDLCVSEGLVHIVATRPGLEEEEHPDLDVLLATGQDGEQSLIRVPAIGRDGIEFEIPPLPGVGCVSGRVVTAEGAPVAARVDARGQRARRWGRIAETDTAPDGTFLLEGVEAGGTDLTALSESSWADAPVNIEAGKTTSCIDIVVPGGRAFAQGRVLGLDGRAGACAIDCNSSRRHRVAANGTFAFPATVWGGNVTVAVLTADGRTARVERAAQHGAAVKLGDIALEEPNVLAFRVVAAADSAPIPHAAAALYSLSPYAPPAEEPADPPWRADEEGRLRIVIPRDGQWGIQVRAHGFSGVNLPSRKVGEQVALKPVVAIAGHVRYGAGGPAAGVRVRAVSSDPSAQRDDRQTTTAADGRFRIEGLVAVPHDIIVESTADGPSIAGSRLAGVRVPNESLKIAVGAVRTIEGRVVDILGRPVADARLRARQRRGSAPGCTLEAQADANGAFRIPGAFAGTYDLHVNRADRWIETSPKGVAAGTTDVVLRAEIGLRIAGKVVDEHGNPRAGWLVTAQHGWTDAFDHRARSDGEGRFVIEELEGGPWNLTLGLHARRPPDSGGERVPAGAEDVVLVLK
jgi:uncharacterized GH25 family protein